MPPPSPSAHGARWAKAFAEAMADFAFLPAGRILAGAGTGRAVTLFNCFVMGRIEDDLTSIFENVKEAALTMQQGGGIGHDFSTLRPKGALVKSIGADASGPVSFMDVWDAMCRTIMSAGARRGAMMATLRCDHPDIEAFIDAKADPARLRNFNLSVLVTDAFIRAVRNDEPWDLVFDGKVYRTVRRARAVGPHHARDLRLRRARRRLHRPHQCREQPRLLRGRSAPPTLAASSRCRRMAPACWARSISPGWSTSRSRAEARLDEARLEALTATAVRFLDDAIDVSNYPLPAQKKEAKAKRRIGLGVTGLADALILCGVRYGTPEAVALAERWMAAIERAAYLRQRRAGAREGRLPALRCGALPGRAATCSACPRTCARRSPRTACATASLTSIAPTGTISLLAGNVSSGIEPVFDFRYERRVLERDGSTRTETVEDYAHALYRAEFGARRAADARPSSRPRSSPPARTWRCRRPCSATSTAPSPRPSTAPPTSASRPSRTSTSRPTTWASRAARPTGPTP